MYGGFFMNKKHGKKLFETIGSLFIDLGKLAFGSLVLGAILNRGIDLFIVFLFGAVFAAVLFVAGILFIIFSEEV
jgi:hypothetical protein